MSDKSTIRYIGYRSLPDGGRGYDFSLSIGAEEATMVTIDASRKCFQGPDQIAIQEAAAICYETLKFRIQAREASTPDHFPLTAADIAQHRRSQKGAAGRR